MKAYRNTFRTSPIARLPLVIGASALLFAACGGSENVAGDDSSNVTNLAFVDDQFAAATTSTTLIAAAPDVLLSEADGQLVRFEATWICELQRRTFETQTGRDDALVEKLAESGLDAAAYHEFRDRVNTDQDLRDSILFSYQETCRP